MSKTKRVEWEAYIEFELPGMAGGTVQYSIEDLYEAFIERSRKTSTTVFMELVVDNERSLLFVGVSEKAILEDTQGGTFFGGVTFESYRIVSEQYVRDNSKYDDKSFVDIGMSNIADGSCSSFMVSSKGRK